VLDIVIPISRPRLAPAVTVGPGSQPTAHQASPTRPSWRFRQRWRHWPLNYNKTVMQESNRSHSFLNSLPFNYSHLVLRSALPPSIRRSRFHLFISFPRRVSLLVSLPPQTTQSCTIFHFSSPADDAAPSRCSTSSFRHLDLASPRQLQSAPARNLLPQEAPLPAGHCSAVAKSVLLHLAVLHWRPPMITTAARTILLIRPLPRGRVGAFYSTGAPGRRTTRVFSCNKSTNSHSSLNSPPFDYSHSFFRSALPPFRHVLPLNYFLDVCGPPRVPPSQRSLLLCLPSTVTRELKLRVKPLHHSPILIQDSLERNIVSLCKSNKRSHSFRAALPPYSHLLSFIYFSKCIRNRLFRLLVFNYTPKQRVC